MYECCRRSGAQQQPMGIERIFAHQCKFSQHHKSPIMNNGDDHDLELQPVALRKLFKVAYPPRTATTSMQMEPPDDKGGKGSRVLPLTQPGEDVHIMQFETDASILQNNTLVTTPTPRAVKHQFFNTAESLSLLASDDQDSPARRSAGKKSDKRQSKQMQSTKRERSKTNVLPYGQSAPSLSRSSTEESTVKSEEATSTRVKQLVEIKPRLRQKSNVESRRKNSSTSAFDGIPPVETYDPSWNTAPLRVEGGQLRDRRDGNRSQAPLLPSAFRGVSSSSSSSSSSADERVKGMRRPLSAVAIGQQGTSRGVRRGVKQKARNTIDRGANAQEHANLETPLSPCSPDQTDPRTPSTHKRGFISRKSKSAAKSKSMRNLKNNMPIKGERIVPSSSMYGSMSPRANIQTNEESDSSPPEKLVEIKPLIRQSRTIDFHRNNTGTSAFDDTPPVETYDPLWTTAPLRVEGGQLRNRRDGNRAQAPLLPNAFRGVSSSSSSSDDERVSGLRSAFSILGMGRHSSREGARSESKKHRRRNVIECVSKAKVALGLLDMVLRQDFGADIVAIRQLEIRARLIIADAPRFIVVNSVDGTNACTLIFRRSLTDTSKLDNDTFEVWMNQVRARLSRAERVARAKARIR